MQPCSSPSPGAVCGVARAPCGVHGGPRRRELKGGCVGGGGRRLARETPSAGLPRLCICSGHWAEGGGTFQGTPALQTDTLGFRSKRGGLGAGMRRRDPCASL